MRFLIPIILLFSLTVSAYGDSPNLQVTADASHVSVRGASSGGTVFFVGYLRSVRGYEPVFRRIERLIDADTEGRAELTLPVAHAHDAFFVAIDLTTGAFGSAVPPGRGSRGGTLPAAALLKGHNGRVRAVDVEGDYVFVIVVRPHPSSSAWGGAAGDGAQSDKDGHANGRIEVAMEALTSLRGGGASPADLENGDIVFVFPAHRMTFLAGVVRP